MTPTFELEGFPSLRGALAHEFMHLLLNASHDATDHPWEIFYETIKDAYDVNRDRRITEDDEAILLQSDLLV